MITSAHRVILSSHRKNERMRNTEKERERAAERMKKKRFLFDREKQLYLVMFGM